MPARTGRGRRASGADHGGFGPAEGSFEFTGENSNFAARLTPRHDALIPAARAFLRRVGMR
jgi:hypothetical protein